MDTSEKEDFLNEDSEIPGQKFCLLSFLSPENVLKDKQAYFFQQFVNRFEMSYKTNLLETFLANQVKHINDSLETHAIEFEKKDLSGVAITCRESKIRLELLINNLHEFSKKNISELSYDNIKTSYDDYLYVNKSRLEDEFYQKNNFRTTVRGLKIRGTYSSKEEAVMRSKHLQRQDKLHNIFIGEIGKWLPWDPEPSQIKDNEYAEEELNVLMKKYKENEEAREEFYREKKANSRKTNPYTSESNQSNETNENNETNVNSVQDNMFNTKVGDLALERKMDKKD
jgi:hypothetical protein